jgi:hypothetical protein
LRNYSEDPANPDDGDWVVVVPSIHPGAISYRTDDRAARVFTLTGFFVWLAYSEALKSTALIKTKREMCEDIIKGIEAVTGEGTPFHEALEVALEKMSRAWRQAFRNKQAGQTISRLGPRAEVDVSSLSKGMQISKARRAKKLERIKELFSEVGDYVSKNYLDVMNILN